MMNTSHENISYLQNNNHGINQSLFKKNIQDNNESSFRQQAKIKSNQKIWNQSMVESQQKSKDFGTFEINECQHCIDDQIDLNYSQNLSQQTNSIIDTNIRKVNFIFVLIFSIQQTKSNDELNTNATFLSKNTLTLGNFQSPTYINLNYLQQFIKNNQKQKVLDELAKQQQEPNEINFCSDDAQLKLIDNTSTDDQKLQEPQRINVNKLLLQYDTLDELKELGSNSPQTQTDAGDKQSMGTTLFEFKNYLNINMMLKDYEKLKSECQKYQYEIFQKNEKIIHLETYYQQVISQQQLDIDQLEQTINNQEQIIVKLESELSTYQSQLSEQKQENNNLHSILEQYSLMINNQENQQNLINHQPMLDQLTLASSTQQPNSVQSNSFSFYSNCSKYSKRVQSVSQLKSIAQMQKSIDSLQTHKFSKGLTDETLTKIMELLETNNTLQIIEKIQELVKRLQTYNKFQDSLTIIIKQCHPEISMAKSISLKDAWKFIKIIFAEYIDLKKSSTITIKSEFTKKKNRTDHREVLKDSSNLTLNQCTNINNQTKDNVQNYYFCSKTFNPSNSHQRYSMRKSSSNYQNENLSFRPITNQKNSSYQKL